MRHWSDCWIVLQIDSSLLSGGDASTLSQRHWVVVNPHRQPLVRVGGGGVVPLQDALGAVPVGSGAGGGKVDLTQWQTSLSFVTWGQESRSAIQPRLGFLAGRIYGGFALSRIP